MTEARKKGRGSDAFYRIEGEPAPALPKRRGRKKVYVEPRVKVSFWIRRSQVRELERLKRKEQDRKDDAGEDPRTVTMTAFIDEAIAEFLARRRRKAGT